MTVFNTTRESTDFHLNKLNFQKKKKKTQRGEEKKKN